MFAVAAAKARIRQKWLRTAVSPQRNQRMAAASRKENSMETEKPMPVQPMITQTPIKPAKTLAHTLGLTFSWRMTTESVATRTGFTHTMAEKHTRGTTLQYTTPE